MIGVGFETGPGVSCATTACGCGRSIRYGRATAPAPTAMMRAAAPASFHCKGESLGVWPEPRPWCDTPLSSLVSWNVARRGGGAYPLGASFLTRTGAGADDGLIRIGGGAEGATIVGAGGGTGAAGALNVQAAGGAAAGSRGSNTGG